MKQHRILRAVVLAVSVTAVMNLAWQFYHAHLASLERQRLYEEYGGIVCYMGPDADEVSRLLITPCLIVAFIGSRLRRRALSKLLYMSGLCGSAALYTLWWSFYSHRASMAEADGSPIRHIAYLYEANYWDICIAASMLLLFLWEVRGAALARFRPTTACRPTTR
ncbi:MAG TPA: hypothetical protein VF656_10530 [Pyrinomonadaceae bacterium]